MKGHIIDGVEHEHDEKYGLVPSLCKACNAACCRYIAIEIDEPEDEQDIENIRWYLVHKNVVVYIDDEDRWILEFHTDCKMLDENNRCTYHSKRPIICKEHMPDVCVKSDAEGEPWEIRFENIEQFEKYVDEHFSFEKPEEDN
jgi:Fe-S-cluster containining protein